MNGKDVQARRRVLRKWLNLTAVALLCALLALVSATFFFAHEAQSVRETVEYQRELNRSITTLHAALIALTDAETGQRGYLLTGKDRYLLPYQQSVRSLPQILQDINAIPAIQPFLPAHLKGIREAMSAKYAELAESLRLYDSGDAGGAMALVQADIGQHYMEQARGDIAAALTILGNVREAVGAKVLSGSLKSERLGVLAASALLISVLLAAFQIGALWLVQRRFEQALTASEQQYRAIVEEQTELIALSKADGTLAYVNPSYARFFQMLPDELAGHNFFDSEAVHGREAAREQLATVISTGQAIEREVRISGVDGQPQWIAWRHRVQRVATGERLVHSVGREITWRKRAEETLRASESFLLRTGRVAGVGGWEFDIRTRGLTWSDQVKRIHEVAGDFMPTLESAIEFYAPESRAVIRDAVESALTQGTSWDLGLPLITALGRRIWVRAVGEVEKDQEGTPIRLVGTLQDITERKRLEVRLEANERFLREVTDNVPVSLVYLDLEQRIRFANRRFRERFGQAMELIGQNIADVVEIARTPLKAALMQLALAGQSQRFEDEDSMNGDTQHIETYLIPDVLTDGRVHGVLAIGVDITHRKSIERALRDLTEVFDNTTDYVAQANWRGEVLYLNPAARRAVGFTPDQALDGHAFSEFYTPETTARFGAEIIPAVNRHGVWVGETSLLLNGWRTVPINHMVIAHREAQGRVARYTSIMRDITSEVTSRLELARQTARLNAIVEAIPAMVAVWDLDLRYRLVNRAFERWRKKGREEFLGRTIEEAVGAAEHELSLPWIQRALAGETVTHEKEYVGALESRHVSVTYTPLRLEDASVGGFIGVAQDITLHREEHQRLRLLSERDSLTGLLNRVGFETYLRQKSEQDGGSLLAVLFIDLDHFKPINDRYGHATGDEILRMFGERLQHIVRPTDAVARLGGDEFGVVLAGVREPENAAMVADKIVQAAKQPFQLASLSLTVSASVGVAFNADAEGGWKGLVARADSMVYQAKSAGRGRRALAVGETARMRLG